MVEIKNDYVLGEKKSLHLPGAHLDLPILDDKDKVGIEEFAVKSGIDMVAISLVRTADNVQYVRDLLKANPPGDKIKIIAKIENRQGLENLEEILAVADGIMIMRK